MSGAKQDTVGGLLIGTRKAGTTWVYENLRSDPGASVSDVVKESGFFSGRRGTDAREYEALFPDNAGAPRVEVDTSICYHEAAPDLIEAYNPAMQLVLVFREPAAFLASRYTHSKRKGEIAQDNIADALAANAWLQGELDYGAILDRFGRFADRGALTVLRYELLQEDAAEFYLRCKEGLGLPRSDFEPDLAPVNISRNSRFALASAILGKGAFAARKMKMDRLVNSLKGLGLHRGLETANDDADKKRLEEAALIALKQAMPETIDHYADMK